MVIAEKEVEVIDEEWLSLIFEARKLGLSVEEVRNFLNQNKMKEILKTGM